MAQPVSDLIAHGIPASLIASMLKVAFSSQRNRLEEPDQLMKSLNALFCGKIRDNYITAGYLPRFYRASPLLTL